MNLAVLTYQYVTKPDGMPDAWPAEVIELRPGVSFPPDGRTGWVEMTQEAYATHLSTHQSGYNTWASANLKDMTPAIGENYLEAEYIAKKNYLARETWWRDRTATGVYSTKVKETLYTYSGNTLTQSSTSYYAVCGEILRTSVTKFFADTAANKTYTEKE